MSAKKTSSKVSKVEEPPVVYESSQLKSKGIDRATFDFDTEFANGLTPEEFKAEMLKRIKAYPWKK
jgi:hypothetical protein